MNVVGDLLARDRRSDSPALVIGDGRQRSYHEILTNAYKAGNVLRYLGVGSGHTVAVAPVPSLPPVLALFGAAQLGAATRFDPELGIENGDRVVLVPASEEAEYEPAPGTNLVVFDGEPTAPETTSWEESVWSENPAFPPTDVDPGSTLLESPGGAVTHAEALAGATEVAERYGLAADSRVVVRAPLSHPGTIVAGLLAPLVVGGSVVLIGAEAPPGDTPRGDLAVRSFDEVGAVPEPETIDPADVPLGPR